MAGMWKPYRNAEELIDAAIGGRLERFMSEALDPCTIVNYVLVTDLQTMGISCLSFVFRP